MPVPPITDDRNFSKVMDDLLDIANIIIGEQPFLISYIDECTLKSLKVMNHEILKSGMWIPIEKTYCYEVYESKKPLLVPNITKDERGRIIDTAKSLGLCSYVGVPILLADGTVFGTFCTYNKQPNKFDEKTITILEKLASFLAYAIDLQILNAKDSMTGLYNRRFWEKVYDNLSELEGDHTIAVLDIDSLKQVNDKFGHEKGDQLIRNISSIILETIPRDAYGFRLGGDEFGIAFFNKNISQSKSFIEEIKEKCHYVNITFSAGITDTKKTTYDNLATRADQLLYESKSRGKNKISEG